MEQFESRFCIWKNWVCSALPSSYCNEYWHSD